MENTVNVSRVATAVKKERASHKTYIRDITNPAMRVDFGKNVDAQGCVPYLQARGITGWTRASDRVVDVEARLVFGFIHDEGHCHSLFENGKKQLSEVRLPNLSIEDFDALIGALTSFKEDLQEYKNLRQQELDERRKELEDHGNNEEDC